MIIVPQPPMPTGELEAQVAQLYKYLRELEESLQVSLNTINYTSFDSETLSKLEVR